MKMKRFKFCSAVLILAFAGMGLAGTLFASEPLEIISGDYTTLDLNSELFGHDSIDVNSTGRSIFIWTPTKSRRDPPPDEHGRNHFQP